MTEEEKIIINNYKFPKYYKFFYKWYTKWIGNTIFLLIILSGLLMIIFGDFAFDVIKGVFFFALGLVLWAFLSKVFKTTHLKRYLKKSGMTLTKWNELTKGITFENLENNK